ncbi:proteasome 26S non-ATPase subunit 9, putative [Trypanosoma brucei gambiense DAL972]|uniref:Proteasome 26S non-ATPase subunit 9, putative n=1 Tax=Trypanosoma brucei gambiense (strain MHOM/CI/86/DAL972) TaxID=679716 RepID=C9ZW47_TRYB9|nr:proteasome 26S non-ATPase subunit 9, putative [Trypanosoma brucei gambiense DAL972]CBH13636.1 proteasome 26S non-ATPase subunit 9, putative [Trypanosoma brucei gambiense DAL972]|eukprot:XP_011775912.1 proteasome 26S non-ATPase subunit 9, putative [Trypanosoma brucei gambiense DAL972]
MSGTLLKEELLQLDNKRRSIMRDIEEAMTFLNSTPVGLRGSLVDSEGFPRDDCDLYAVRRARHTVNCGHNDLKSIEATIHEKLSQLHEECRGEAEEQMQRDKMKKKSEDDQRRRDELKQVMSSKEPFVRVVDVATGSPAEEGGLICGHLIVQYGDVDAEKVLEGGFGEMARVTSSYEGQMLRVWVRSPSDDDCGGARELFIVPQRWRGEGLLGCTFEPMKLN